MKRIAWALMLGLAACGRGGPEAVAPEAVSVRQAGTMIASTTRGAPGDLSGEWVVAQSYPGASFAAPGTRVTVAEGVWRFAGPGGASEARTTVTAPGRYRVEGGPELWVLWVDDDFRTAAVGTPDGSLGWIMNRPGEASGDRTAAAREVLEWSGYDLGRLGSGA